MQVERGETLNIVLNLEICEELSAEVEVKGIFMHPFSFDYSEYEDGFDAEIKLYPMLCTLRANSPEPRAREGVHDILEWVSADILDEYEMLKGDMRIVGRYSRSIGKGLH